MALRYALLLFLVPSASASPLHDRSLRGTEAGSNASNAWQTAKTALNSSRVEVVPSTPSVLRLPNFTAYLTNSVDSFASSLRRIMTGKNTNGTNTSAGFRTQGGCLCIFDVDRTLTGRQGDTRSCPGNKVVWGTYDDAYGGGQLTLSKLGQNLWGTFCGSCHIRAITAHPHRRGGLPISESVVGCNGGCKARHAKRMAREMGISRSNVYMFDDKSSNIRPFHGTGMNAHQVSCSSREGSHGLCGATMGEIRNSKGVTTCR